MCLPASYVLQVSCLPNFQRDLANRVFIDVMNEPDSMQISWEPNGDKPGAHQLYLGTADALWELTPGAVMFMMEGAWHGGHLPLDLTARRRTWCWCCVAPSETHCTARTGGICVCHVQVV